MSKLTALTITGTTTTGTQFTATITPKPTEITTHTGHAGEAHQLAAVIEDLLDQHGLLTDLTTGPDKGILSELPV